MIEVRAFRDGTAVEDRLTLGGAERLIQDERCFVWIDITDPQRDEIDALGAIFALHPLTIEDAHHRHQRPKVELFEGYAFVVVHPLAMRDDAAGGELVDQELHVGYPAALGTMLVSAGILYLVFKRKGWL